MRIISHPPFEKEKRPRAEEALKLKPSFASFPVALHTKLCKLESDQLFIQ